jgi:hypothetical protein
LATEELDNQDLSGQSSTSDALRKNCELAWSVARNWRKSLSDSAGIENGPKIFKMFLGQKISIKCPRSPRDDIIADSHVNSKAPDFDGARQKVMSLPNLMVGKSRPEIRQTIKVVIKGGHGRGRIKVSV